MKKNLHTKDLDQAKDEIQAVEMKVMVHCQNQQETRNRVQPLFDAVQLATTLIEIRRLWRELDPLLMEIYPHLSETLVSVSGLF